MRADFRSDTLTMPSKEMLEVMRTAKVGDDVFGEDPSINLLEEEVAKRFGMESAIFCPSGTMANQIAIKMHTSPGDEVICDELSHIYLYEGGGIASNSGVSVNLLKGDRGRISASQVKAAIHPDDPHFPTSSLVSIENTCNKGGGSIYSLEEIEKIRRVCQENSMAFHLDGARLFNAIVESDYTAKDIGAKFDSISICLSKGLGAPVGSVLISSKEKVHKARRIRKAFGGGMRQAGGLAAAGLYALNNNVDRLKEDHRRAKELESELSKISFVKDIAKVDTNIVVLSIEASYELKQLLDDLVKTEVFAVAFGPQKLRLVCHLDITDVMIDQCIQSFKKLDY